MNAEPTAEPTGDLRSFLAVLSRPGDVREVRIPTSRRTDSGYFDDPVALAAAVRPYDGRENVYITGNPVASARSASYIRASVSAEAATLNPPGGAPFFGVPAPARHCAGGR